MVPEPAGASLADIHNTDGVEITEGEISCPDVGLLLLRVGLYSVLHSQDNV